MTVVYLIVDKLNFDQLDFCRVNVTFFIQTPFTYKSGRIGVGVRVGQPFVAFRNFCNSKMSCEPFSKYSKWLLKTKIFMNIVQG